jgi:hypothetical protein
VIGERGIELDELNQSSAVSLYLVRVIPESGIELDELHQSTAVSLSTWCE